MMTHREAKRIVNEHFRAEGSTEVAGRATHDRRYNAWVVDHFDPADDPDIILTGDAPLVVMEDGAIHYLGSESGGSLDGLMLLLGVAETGDAWEREGEGLALLADLDMEEAKGLAAYADEQHRKRQQQHDV